MFVMIVLKKVIKALNLTLKHCQICEEDNKLDVIMKILLFATLISTVESKEMRDRAIST